MDPSISLCKFGNSFTKSVDNPIVHTYVNKNGKITTSLVPSDQVVIEPDEVFDLFKNVSYNPFSSRDALVLANVDMAFNFTKQQLGYIIKQSTQDYTFACVDDKTGGFTEYMLYRNPNSYGYSDHVLDETRINPINYNNLAGESREQNITEDLLEIEPEGLDAVVFGQTDLLSNLVVGLKTVKIGGTLVTPIPRLSKPIIDLIYLTSRCFEKIGLIKPISTPFYLPKESNTHYLVGINSKVNNLDIISFLSQINQTVSVFPELPSDYLDFIKSYVDSLNYEGNIDIYKCKAIWNLPQIDQ